MIRMIYTQLGIGNEVHIADTAQHGRDGYMYLVIAVNAVRVGALGFQDTDHPVGRAVQLDLFTQRVIAAVKKFRGLVA